MRAGIRLVAAAHALDRAAQFVRALCELGGFGHTLRRLSFGPLRILQLSAMLHLAGEQAALFAAAPPPSAHSTSPDSS